MKTQWGSFWFSLYISINTLKANIKSAELFLRMIHTAAPLTSTALSHIFILTLVHFVSL